MKARRSPSPLDLRPEMPAPPDFTAPVPATFHLRNGLPVWFLPRRGLPLVSVRLIVSGGASSDPPSQAGLCSLTDLLLTRGAGDRDAHAFASLTEQLAMTLHASSDDGSTTLALDTRTDHLQTGLELLSDAALRPRLDAEELVRARLLRAGELAIELDDPGAVARGVGAWAFFGPAHPYAHPNRGTRAGVEAIDPESVRASWASRFSADRAHLVAVGDIAQGELEEILEARFGDWARAGVPPATPPPPRPIRKGPALYFVDNPGSSQSVLHVLGPAPRATDPCMFAARMALIALGGTFTSRLNRRLREEKGYTYGVQARLMPDAHCSTAMTHTAVQAEATAPALVDLLAEMRKLRRGIRKDELNKARGARQTQLVAAFEPRSGAADALAALVQTGRGPRGFVEELELCRGLSAAEVRGATASLPLDRSVVVVVGDLDKVRAAVEAAVPGRWTVVAKDPWAVAAGDRQG